MQLFAQMTTQTFFIASCKENSEKTLDITFEQVNRSVAPSTSRIYLANDRMFGYKTIDELFHIDAFFSTKKFNKSLKGNAYCQIFFTDKGFVCLVPTKSKGQVSHALKKSPKK